MKKILYLTFLSFFFFTSKGAIKEVQFDWANPAIVWENQSDYVPCLEPFYINLINCPAGTQSVRVIIYESQGKYLSSAYRTGTDTVRKDLAAVSRIYTGFPKGNGVYSVLISEKLKFHRFYYIDVEITSAVVTTVNASSVTTIGPATVTNPTPDLQISTATSTTTTAPATPAPGGAATPAVTTTSTVTTRETRRRPKPVYAIPLRSEISYVQFLGTIGDAAFGRKGLKDLDHNIALFTGVKIKFRPVSTNPAITRFGLYPRASRPSIIIGTALNELSYKSSTTSAVIAGLKPMIGIDYEFLNGSIGVSLGAFFCNQELGNKLTADKHLVTGVFLGLSFSADVFQSLRNSIPASQNFPNTGANENH